MKYFVYDGNKSRSDAFEYFDEKESGKHRLKEKCAEYVSKAQPEKLDFLMLCEVLITCSG